MELINMIRTLDETIFDSRKNRSIGFADGKMGYCIYFYYIGRITDNKEYMLKAELLIDEIIRHINEIKIYDVKNGLSGIGLGIDYLIKNRYVEGDSNVILKDIDNMLFKQLCYPDKLSDYDLSLQLQLIYYFTVRLEKQKKNSENEYLFREVIIDSINHLSEKFHLLFSEEPVSFSMENPQMLFLLILSCCKEIYKDKIYKILKEVSFYILSKIPYTYANKLYLLYVMNMVNKKTNTDNWNNHIQLLAKETDIEYIIEHELADKIYFSNGLPAMYALLSGMENYIASEQIYRYRKLIVNKIENAYVWHMLLDDKHYLKENHGLFSGYMGASIVLYKHYYDENRFN